jgi:hypothetical protein
VFVYGIPIDWDRLRKLKSDKHEQFIDERTDSDIGKTEYI